MKTNAKNKFEKAGKELVCPYSSKTESLDSRKQVHTVPYHHFATYLTLGRFTLRTFGSCTFTKACCSEGCKGLPAAPCGLVKGRCVLHIAVYDRYDFPKWMWPWRYLGKPYDIHMSATESFHLGPEVICGSSEQCE